MERRGQLGQTCLLQQTIYVNPGTTRRPWLLTTCTRDTCTLIPRFILARSWHRQIGRSLVPLPLIDPGARESDTVQEEICESSIYLACRDLNGGPPSGAVETMCHDAAS